MNETVQLCAWIGWSEVGQDSSGDINTQSQLVFNFIIYQVLPSSSSFLPSCRLVNFICWSLLGLLNKYLILWYYALQGWMVIETPGWNWNDLWLLISIWFSFLQNWWEMRGRRDESCLGTCHATYRMLIRSNREVFRADFPFGYRNDFLF